jgi:hypothetical protein
MPFAAATQVANLISGCGTTAFATVAEAVDGRSSVTAARATGRTAPQRRNPMILGPAWDSFASGLSPAEVGLFARTGKCYLQEVQPGPGPARRACGPKA